MSYFTGFYYVWNDIDGMHIWSGDGYDQWDISGWAAYYDEQSDETIRRQGMENASGVGIPMEVFDKLVLLRLAEMLEEGSVNNSINSLLETEKGRGNVGTFAFRRQYQIISKMTEYYSQKIESDSGESNN